MKPVTIKDKLNVSVIKVNHKRSRRKPRHSWVSWHKYNPICLGVGLRQRMASSKPDWATQWDIVPKKTKITLSFKQGECNVLPRLPNQLPVF